MARARRSRGSAEGLILVGVAWITGAGSAAVGVLSLGLNATTRDHIGQRIVGPATKDTAIGVVAVDEVLFRKGHKVVSAQGIYTLNVA